MTRETFVYFLRPVGAEGPIKIGCSADPKTRLRSLMSWSPFPLEFIGVTRGDFVHEARLLRLFREHRLHGEWFRPAPDLLAFISAACAAGQMPGHQPGLGADTRTPLRGLPSILRKHGISRARFADKAGVHLLTVSTWSLHWGSRSSAGRALVALNELGVHCELRDLLGGPAPRLAPPQRAPAEGEAAA